MTARRNRARPLRLGPAWTLLLTLLGGAANAQWHEEAAILEAVGGGTLLGRAIAVDGDVAVVGASEDDTRGEGAGAAYVYRLDGLSWVREAKLLAANGSAGDQFGMSVDVDGDTIIVGAPLRNETYFAAGAAYVFRYDGAARVWREEDYLAIPNAPGDLLGFAVGISGDWAVAGSPYWDDDDDNQGAFHIWRDLGGSWAYHTGRYAAEANANLGFSIAIDGDIIVAGAPNADGLGVDEGGAAASVLYRGEWGPIFALLVSDLSDNAHFGTSVAVDGISLLIGAPGHGQGGTASGAVFALRGLPYRWEYDGMIRPPGGRDGDQFGVSVAVSGDLALVGAPYRDDGASAAGAVYACSTHGSGWSADSRIVASDGRQNDLFGTAVAVAGNVGLIGAPFRDGGVNDDGALYVHRCAYVLGTRADERAGCAVASAGDVDGDGFADIVVGAPYQDDQDGRVYVFSGRTRLALFSRGGAKGERFGLSVAGVGDVDRDGHDDVIAGAPYFKKKRGRIRVLSGRDGRTLDTIEGDAKGDRFGHAVAGGIDVDDDNRPDILVGAPYNDDAGGSAGKVYVYSGRHGTELETITGRHAGDRFGWSLAALGKVDGDDFGDFAVGAPKNDDRAKNAGAAYLYSGRRFRLLYPLRGTQANARFGSALAAAGRADGDGRADLIVGSPYYDRSWGGNAGRVDLYSGRDGDRLWSRKGTARGDRLGWSVAGAGDFDGDGRDDLAIGVPRHDESGSNAGRVDIRSGRDGSLLARFEGQHAGDQCGFALASLEDLDADGRAEFLTGAPLNDQAARKAGKAHVLFSSAAGTFGPDVDVDDAYDEIGRLGPQPPDLDLGAGDSPELVALLVEWGACDACAGDVDGDGDVDVDDLIEFLDVWEP